MTTVKRTRTPTWTDSQVTVSPSPRHPEVVPATARSRVRPEVSNADLILCGHVPYPLVQRTALPNGRTAPVVRSAGWLRGEPDGSGWMVDYWTLENAGPASLGFSGWAFHRELRSFRPRDPNWTDQALRAGRVP